MQQGDDDLYEPMPTLAKIGRRYYWAIYRHARPDEEEQQQHNDIMLVRILDGFTDTREEAAEQIAAYFDRTDAGSQQELQRRLYDQWHGRRYRDCVAGHGIYGAGDAVTCLARTPGKG